MGEPMTINELTRRCGFFNPTIESNNGYGCDHPRQEDRDGGEGRCFAFSCPIATCVDEDGDLVAIDEAQWRVDAADRLSAASLPLWEWLDELRFLHPEVTPDVALTREWYAALQAYEAAKGGE